MIKFCITDISRCVQAKQKIIFESENKKQFMTTVLILMTLGILLGIVIGKLPKLLKVIDRLITYAIYLLLFLLGVSVGINDKIIENLDDIGVKALLVTLGAVAGSVLLLWILYKTAFISKQKEIKNEKNTLLFIHKFTKEDN